MNFDELAAIHHASFTHSPRPWSAEEIKSLLASPSVHLFEQTGGFAICRIAGPEAELLTIAVHPDHRRQRIAQNLIEVLHKFVEYRSVKEVFLEVEENNDAAFALYNSCGYCATATRKDYYVGPNGQKTTAIIMRHTV